MLVYYGDLKIIEYPGVVIRNGLLVKPIYVYVGELERGLIGGNIPITRPVVLGSTGVVKVVEVFDKSTEYTGKMCTVSPLGKDGILGIGEDGLLASYASIHSSHVDEETTNSTPFDAIRPIIKHGAELAYKSSEPVLIEGCGLIGLAAGLILRYGGVEPVFYCESSARNAFGLSFHVNTHISSITKKWNTVILTDTSMRSKHRLLTGVDYNRLVISKLTLTSWLPIRETLSSVKVEIVGKNERCDNMNGDNFKKVLGDVTKNIKVYQLSKLEDSIGLLPPRGLGSIFIFSPNLQ